MVQRRQRKSMRVSDVAKRLNLSTSTVLDILRKAGYNVRSSQSEVTPEMEKVIREHLHELEDQELEKIEKRKAIWGEEKPEEGRKRRSERRFRHREEKKEKEERKEKGEPEKKVENTQLKRERKPSPPKPRRRKRKKTVQEEEEKPNILVLDPDLAISTEMFAKFIGKDVIDVIQVAFKELALILKPAQILSHDEIELLAEAFGYTVEFKKVAKEEERKEEKETEEELTERRPPIVTVMGHVDHGKTTLLDYIRRTKIAEQEEGGITQSIGAYQIKWGDSYITFIDTPGHEAFTSMRARGAQVTDIVVLVVAANEGVKDQTIESINLARSAGVPIIVAINKIDLPEADVERTKRQLSELGLIPDDWGGDTIMVPISAKKGTNIPDLLDAILLVAEDLDLRTTSKGKARGVVLEAQLTKMGKLASVIIMRGTLKVKDPIVVGTTYGRVKALIVEEGVKGGKKGMIRKKEAKPGEPITVLGLEELPVPGDKLEVVDSEKEAKRIAEERKRLAKIQLQRAELQWTTERTMKLIQQGELKELPLVVKAESHGALEAVIDSISHLQVGEVKPLIVQRGVGMITESDIELAEATNAIVIGFRTQVDSKAKRLAREKKVSIRLYKIIYHMLEDVEKMLKGMIEPKLVEEDIGVAEVKAVFKIAKIGFVAGCLVVSGIVEKGAMCRVKREGEVIHTGKIVSLKRFKDDVDVVKEGQECGIRVDGYSKPKEGDILEVYRIVEKIEY